MLPRHPPPQPLPQPERRDVWTGFTFMGRTGRGPKGSGPLQLFEKPFPEKPEEWLPEDRPPKLPAELCPRLPPEKLLRLPPPECPPEWRIPPPPELRMPPPLLPPPPARPILTTSMLL